MPSAAHRASVGHPIRCTCDDTGPGSFREVTRAFDDFREIDLAAQRALGIVLPPLPDAETLARADAAERNRTAGSRRTQP